MLTRRIVISACALCLAIPTAAGASPATDPPKAKDPSGITSTDPQNVVKAKGPYGVTTSTDPQNIVKAKGPYGATTSTDPQNIVKAKGPYGVTTAGAQNFVKAKGPYGMTTTTGPQNTTAATAHAAGASSHDDMNDWRTAAISELALLAALALGSALLLTARRRAPGLGT
jgi:ribosomal protein L6P/L9E